jgi:two-component system, NtrC family, response regulator
MKGLTSLLNCQAMSDEKPKLLIVEDDPGLQKQLKWSLEAYELLQASDRREAITLLRRHEPTVVLQDLGLPPDAAGVSEGFATLKEILSLAPHTKVIVCTGNADKDNALKAIAAGAYDFCQKPLDVDLIQHIVDRALRLSMLEQQNRDLRELPRSSPLPDLITADSGMLRACRMIEKIAPSMVSVLVLGESGTGKELIARGVHALSDRKKGPFIAINCAAIPEQLLESELFGHEKGAFTGAIKTTVGKIEQASGGTLFLDEIGDMPLPLQAKLLRFLQARVIERVGGRQEIPVDTRVVCATNQDLQSRIAEQRFREDLYYRISEAPIVLPPLRERPGDAVLLAHAFLRRFCAEQGKGKRGFAEEALATIRTHSWPGNIRELESRVKTGLLVADEPLISTLDLGLLPRKSDTGAVLNLREVRATAERSAIQQALAQVDGSVSLAAELLGVSRPTLYDLLERYGMRQPADPG